MAEIDPVILELRADLGKYRADLASTTSQVQRLLGRQERDVQRLERQMQKSSAAIAGSLRGLGATLATYFSGRELAGMVDGFTRVQNSLRVAGLEGGKLASVQGDLLDLSGKYGVSIEGLANLYGKATDAGRSFGASESEILKLTEATSQALKITGTSANQASGAILGLSQALASGVVRAEEYNQINEGGLRPLLQAAANTKEFGGDINKLRAAMLDGKVTSEGFFGAIMAGAAQLEGKAQLATLTLAGAFESLTSSLIVYVGTAAQASGVTDTLSEAMKMIADNLDTLIPALAVIAVAIGGRMAAAALVGGTALKSIAAYASIATTSLAGTALAARSAGAALLGAFGGPVGLAITAVALALGTVAYSALSAEKALTSLKDKNKESADSLDELADRIEKAGGSVDKIRQAAAVARGEVNKLSDSFNRASVEAHRMADAVAGAALKTANLEVIQSQTEQANLRRQISDLKRVRSSTIKGPGELLGITANPYSATIREREAQLDQEKRREAAARGRIIGIAEANASGVSLAPPTQSGAPTASEEKKKKGRKGPSGPSAEEIEDRFQSEMYSIGQQTLSARQSLATSAEERAEFELRSVENARVAALNSLEADKDYSAAQKARIADALENLAGFERERVARDLRIAKEEELADLAEAKFRAQSDSLRQEYDLAKSQAQRRKVALQIIDLDYSERDAALERVKNNKDLSDAVRERAAIEQAALRAARGRTEEAARRDTAGPLEQYMDRAKLDADQLNEAFQGVAVDGLQALNDGLTNAIMNSENLGDVFKNVAKSIIADLIRIAIQQTIVNSLMSVMGGGSGGKIRTPGIGDLQGSIGGSSALHPLTGTFNRASGGYVAPGQTVRVNEHRGGAEYLRMGSQGGHVIPLGQVNQQAARPQAQGGGVVRLMIEEAPGFASTVRAEAQGVAIEVVKASAGSLIEAATTETMRRSSRPTLGRSF